ncbi:hypothetical protein P0Y35_17650 [Kiritimatiellaeota bacterium B1221]|nr:hypothetical protein [Kiritimatiellaeota bacterium B1221]
MTPFEKSMAARTAFPEKLYTRPALKKFFLEQAGIPDWLLARCQKEGADLAETLARCWPREGPGLGKEAEEFIHDLLPALKDPERLRSCWDQCKTPERIWVNRLLLGYTPPTVPVAPDPSLPRKQIQAELMYALFSGEAEYSFGLKRGADLVVFARMSVHNATLSAQLQTYIDQNTTLKKGPIREVARGLVGVVSYTAIIPSARHKSGLKVENPRLESLFPPGGLWQAATFLDL